MKRFDQEMAALERRVLRMGDVAEAMVAGAGRALVDHDVSLVPRVLAHEEDVDRLQIEIDREAVRLITLYSPTAADLRFLLMVARITTELERIGDQTVNNCECLPLLLSEARTPILEDVTTMSECSREMVHDALRALRLRNAAIARAVLRADDRVDALNAGIFRTLLARESAGAEPAGHAMTLLLVARSLERIADHATNIGEEVVYMIEGDDIRHRR